MLDHFEAKSGPGRAGAPEVLAPIHRQIAIHYWWRRNQENQSGVAKAICKCWGLSPQAITKYANLHKREALEWIRERQARHREQPDLYPNEVIEQQMILVGKAFQLPQLRRLLQSSVIR